MQTLISPCPLTQVAQKLVVTYDSALGDIDNAGAGSDIQLAW